MKGLLANAINSVYPKATVQTRIVQLIRNSLDHGGWKDRKLVAPALRLIYAAPGEEAAPDEPQAFKQDPCGIKYPSTVQPWMRA